MRMNIKSKLIVSHTSIALLVLASSLIAVYSYLSMKKQLDTLISQEIPSVKQIENLSILANKITAAAPMIIATNTAEQHEKIKKTINAEITSLKIELTAINQKNDLKERLPRLNTVFDAFQASINKINTLVSQKLDIKAEKNRQYRKLEGKFNDFERFINPNIAFFQSNLRNNKVSKKQLDDTLVLYEIRKVGYALNDELFSIEIIKNDKDLFNKKIIIISYLRDLKELSGEIPKTLSDIFNPIIKEYRSISLEESSLLQLHQKDLNLTEQVRTNLEKSRIYAKELTFISKELLTETNQNFNDSTDNLYAQQSYYLKLLLVIATAGIFLALLFGKFFVKKKILDPVDALCIAVKKFKDGAFDSRIEITSDDEIGVTAKVFNEMAHKLQNVIAELHEHKGHLEQEVAKRTEELAHSLKELKKTQTYLIQQNKLAFLGEMMSNIAHHWRQPITIVNLVAESIKVSFEDGELTEELLEQKTATINDILQKMSKTIDDFRSFFAPESEESEFGIADAVHEALAIIQDALENLGIKTEIDIHDNPIIKGYKKEYSQVILNLMTNAKDILITKQNKDKWIKITVKKEQEKSILTVEDNGGGIPKESMDKIFDPYYTTKFKSGGAGLGLYMSKMVIEKNMHGDLSVENTDIGAKFTISL